MAKAKNTHGGSRAGAGRNSSGGSFTVRITGDLIKILKQRYGNTDNDRLRQWIDKLPSKEKTERLGNTDCGPSNNQGT